MAQRRRTVSPTPAAKPRKQREARPSWTKFREVEARLAETKTLLTECQSMAAQHLVRATDVTAAAEARSASDRAAFENVVAELAAEREARTLADIRVTREAREIEPLRRDLAGARREREIALDDYATRTDELMVARKEIARLEQRIKDADAAKNYLACEGEHREDQIERLEAAIVAQALAASIVSNREIGYRARLAVESTGEAQAVAEMHE